MKEYITNGTLALEDAKEIVTGVKDKSYTWYVNEYIIVEFNRPINTNLPEIKKYLAIVTKAFYIAENNRPARIFFLNQNKQLIAHADGRRFVCM